MTLSPTKVESFGGLNLIEDAGEVGWSGAVDLLNIEFDKRGRVRSRDGYTRATTLWSGTVGADLFPSYDPTGATGDRLIVSTDVDINAIDPNQINPNTQSTNARLKGSFSFARSPASGNVYVGSANGSAAGAWIPATTSWNVAIAYTGTSPTGKFFANQPWDNRMVSACRWNTAAGDNGSTVQWSDPGSAVVWGANNYVDLFPNDGESITGLVTWRDLVFAFKGSRFFVFYGTSTDSTGNPIFNYRPIDTGIGCASVRGACAGTDAVYFVNRRGVYRTTGGIPELISSVLDPIFLGSPSAFFASSALNVAQISKVDVSWGNERLYVSYPSGSATTNDRTLVYDPHTGIWTLWDLTVHSLTTIRVSSGQEEIWFGTPGALVNRFGSAYTTDNGTAITSRYRSGFSDLGTPDRKRIHSWRVQGTGAPTLKVATDFGALDTGATVTLGTSPAVDQGTRRYAPTARQLSWQIGATSAWSVNSVVANVAGKRDTE